MIKEHGLWWKYFQDEDFSVLISKDKNEGFTREQAEEIGPQIVNASCKSKSYGQHQYLPVEFDGEKSYVLVDSEWGIKRPKLKDGTHERTLDSSRILEFQTLADWAF